MRTSAAVELRTLPYWELFYAFALVVTVVLIALDAKPLPATLGAVGLLLLLGAWYWIRGRPLVTGGQSYRQCFLYVGVALVLFVGAAVLCANAAWYSPAIIGQVFWLLPLPLALPAVVVITFVPAITFLIDTGDAGSALTEIVPASLIFCALALVIGYMMDRLGTQSKRQGELIERLEASRAQVAELSREAGTAAERERLAREIHDTLAQGFTSIATLTQAASSEMDTDPAAARAHLDLAYRTAKENLGEARSMVSALTPSGLGGRTLADAIRGQVERFGEHSDIPARCEIADELPELGTNAEVVLLRAAQEALANAGKHARASTVTVELSASGGGARLVVADDGVGFDPDQPSGGFGLPGMRARVQQVGGNLNIHSGPNDGTSISLEVPC